MDTATSQTIHAEGSGRVIHSGLIAITVVLIITGCRLVFIRVSPLGLDFEEAQYWYWGQHPAWGYFSKPPLIAWLIAASTGLFGHSEAAVRLLSPVLHGATALIIGATGRQLGGSRLGMWSALIYITMPGVFFSSMLMTTDVPLLCCWAAALYCLARRRDGGGRRWSAFCGLAVGVGLLAKYAMVYFLLCAALYLVISAPARRRLDGGDGALILGTAGIVIAPNLAWNLAHGMATFHHTAGNIGVASWSWHPDGGLAFLSSQLAVFGLLPFALLVGALWWRLADQPDDDRWFLLSFSVPIVAALLIEGLLAQANANWAAPAYVAGSILAARYGLALRPRWLLAATPVCHAIIGTLLLAGALLVTSITLPGARLTALQARLLGWSELGRNVAAQMQREPGTVLLGESRHLLALLSFYVRPTPEIVMWAPPGKPESEFALSNPLQAGGPGPFLLIAMRENPPSLARFSTVMPLESWTVNPLSGVTRNYWSYVLRDFKGY